jgi:hypothetical protein
VSRGVCKVKDGWLEDVSERLKLAPVGDVVVDQVSGERFDAASPASMNFWGFHASAVPLIWAHFSAFLGRLGDPLKDEFYLPMAVETCLRAGELKVRVLGGGTRWFGVTYPQDRDAVKAALAAEVRRGQYPAPLFG